MGEQKVKQQKILIADDSEMNRALLLDILGDSYDVVEAENGAKAVAILQERAEEFSLLLLDIVMPVMDGFEVLAYMNRYHWIEDTPVIMISSENSPIYIERAYDFGVTDYISRPFDVAVVQRRVANTMLLSARQRRLAGIVTEQVYEREKSSKLMITILSHIVEFRNGESGLHVLHINVITDLILRRLAEKTDRYGLTPADIALISTASTLHDIGKISIPGEVLNKKGRLTAEEFEVMKGHTTIGAEMLAALPEKRRNEPLVKTAYEICRWHHERYDGCGYPDGRSGDDIPISAQVVALADVYDALTSQRCYKPAYPHAEAVRMILDGQCGAFNPLLLECLLDIESTLETQIKVSSFSDYDSTDMRQLAQQLKGYEVFSSDRLLQQLEFERQRFQFLAVNSGDAVVSYTVSPPLLTANDAAAACFGLDEPMIDPINDASFSQRFVGDSLKLLREKIQGTTASQPDAEVDIRLRDGDSSRLYHCMVHTIWPEGATEKYTGVVGKLIDIDGDFQAVAEAKSKALQYMTEMRDGGIFRGGRYAMTGTEAWVLLEYLRSAFDTVRLVDAGLNRQVVIDSTGQVKETEHRCFAVWNRSERCENCISAKCLCTKSRLAKFVFIEDEIYHVLAMYVEIDGQPYSMEMINRISNDTMLGAYGQDELVAAIVGHNRKLYIDPLTDIYNRRYFDEQISGLRQVYAVAMMDVDRFKEVNDTYGHLVGDEALKRIAAAVRGCVRKTDPVIRFGGDEFIAVFRESNEAVFRQKLREFRQSVQSIAIDGLPDLRLSISVGGAIGPGRASALLSEADGEMYREKQQKHNIR